MQKMVYKSYNGCREWQSNKNMETMQRLLILMYLKIKNKTFPRAKDRNRRRAKMNTIDPTRWKQKSVTVSCFAQGIQQ
jgi:hypothetical protein